MVSNMDPVDPRELQALQHYLSEYGQQVEIFTNQLQLLDEGRMEATAAIEVLKSIQETGGSEIVLLQVGGGASVRAKVLEPDRVFVSIGSDVVVERTNADAVEYLKDRITEMEASGKKVAETIERIRSQMNEIARRIETGYQQAQAVAQQQGQR
ncbi:MAG TPA: prefoldin subunit alpha [Methanoregulaceae archaeon]|nr:prefoldin subunit alpha [Methanoregulaceae archaeon]